MYDCQRRLLYLIIIIYLIIYIGARVIYIGARRGAGTCTDATTRARRDKALGRSAAARAQRAERLSGANTAKNREAVWVFQILCLPLPDAEEAPAPANAISKSVEVPTTAVRQLCRRLGLCTKSPGLCTRSLGLCTRSPGLCTMVAGTMRKVARTMRKVARSKNKGQKIYII